MTARIGLFLRQAASVRFAPWIFCAIWLGLAVLFVGLGMTARRSAAVQVGRAGFRMPPNPNIQLGALRLQHVINDLAEKHDRTAASLERSIQTTARTTFWLNMAAAFLSVLGFGAQFQNARCSVRFEERATNPWPPEAGGQLTFVNRRGKVSTIPRVPIHDGCFPDGPYGH